VIRGGKQPEVSEALAIFRRIVFTSPDLVKDDQRRLFAFAQEWVNDSLGADGGVVAKKPRAVGTEAETGLEINRCDVFGPSEPAI